MRVRVCEWYCTVTNRDQFPFLLTSTPPLLSFGSAWLSSYEQVRQAARRDIYFMTTHLILYTAPTNQLRVHLRYSELECHVHMSSVASVVCIEKTLRTATAPTPLHSLFTPSTMHPSPCLYQCFPPLSSTSTTTPSSSRVRPTVLFSFCRMHPIPLHYWLFRSTSLDLPRPGLYHLPDYHAIHPRYLAHASGAHHHLLLCG